MAQTEKTEPNLSNWGAEEKHDYKLKNYLGLQSKNFSKNMIVYNK